MGCRGLLSAEEVVLVVDAEEDSEELQVVGVDYRELVLEVLYLVEIELLALTKLNVIINEFCLVFLYKDIGACKR